MNGAGASALVKFDGRDGNRLLFDAGDVGRPCSQKRGSEANWTIDNVHCSVRATFGGLSLKSWCTQHRCDCRQFCCCVHTLVAAPLDLLRLLQVPSRVSALAAGRALNSCWLARGQPGAGVKTGSNCIVCGFWYMPVTPRPGGRARLCGGESKIE